MVSKIEQLKELFLSMSSEEKDKVLGFIYKNRPDRWRKLSSILGNQNTGSAFDQDLVDGLAGELAFLSIASSGKYEVKRDFRVSDKGNIAVEVECRDRPSGLSITTAPFWVYWLSGEEYQDEVALIISTQRLRRIAETCYLTRGGDEGRDGRGVALVYLVPVSKLLASNKRINKFKKRSTQLSLMDI